MANWEVIGNTDPATHICGAESCRDQEWKVEICDELDEDKYPMLEVCLVVGSRWYGHEHIDWTFDLDGCTDEEIRATVESFKKFESAVRDAAERFETAAERAIENR